MKPAPVNATTDCRVDLNDLEGTVVRWEKVLTEDVCPHKHLAKGAPPCGINVAVYTLMDSNCHSGWSECDKEEGNWLWFVACDNRKNGLPVSVGITVRSLEPALLQLQSPHNNESLPVDEYQLPIPLWLFPFYGKSDYRYCEKSCLAVILYSTYEFRRAPVEVEIKITVDRATEGRKHRQKTMLAVAILPAKGKIQPNDGIASKGQKKREEPTASLESIRNSEKSDGTTLPKGAVEETRQINIYNGGKYFERGHYMEPVDIKNFGQINIADKINKVVFNENLDISKEDLDQLKEGIKNLPQDKQANLKGMFGELIECDVLEKREPIIQNIRNFLYDNGVPIAQSLTAAGIFELIRLLSIAV